MYLAFEDKIHMEARLTTEGGSFTTERPYKITAWEITMPVDEDSIVPPYAIEADELFYLVNRKDASAIEFNQGTHCIVITDNNGAEGFVEWEILDDEIVVIEDQETLVYYMNTKNEHLLDEIQASKKYSGFRRRYFR